MVQDRQLRSDNEIEFESIGQCDFW